MPRALQSPYPHQLAGHCGSGALRDLWEFHGLDYGDGPLSEGMAFGLAGGLGFFYVEAPTVTPPLYLVGRTGSMERDVAAHVGARLDVRETSDAEEGWAWVRDEIDAERPPMVWADIAKLPYLRVQLQNTRHVLVVCGYDEDAGTALVADNDREELQECSLTDLAAARDSSGFPGPNRHTTFFYDWPEQLRPASEATVAALARSVTNMRGDPSTFGLQGSNGLRAVDVFAEAYSLWPQRFGERLPDALRLLWVFIVKAGTGGAMFRSLHTEFLLEMAELLDADELRTLGLVYGSLTSAWRQLADCAKAGDHAAGEPCVKTIRQLEHEGVRLMSAYVARRS